jgi:hypothetical protein
MDTTSSMELYTYTALFVIPVCLFNFSLEYLSDSEIRENELKIGISNLIHHFLYAFNILSITVLLILKKPKLKVIIITILFSIIMQIGFLLNNDYCWFTQYINCLINPNRPNRKWRAGIASMIKHYLRGDQWAYSEIQKPDNCNLLIILNTIHFLILLKYSFKI